MAKECTPKEPDYDYPCLTYSGGQCEGERYGLVWLVEWRQLRLDGSYITGSNDVGITSTKNNVADPENRFFTGKLKCISQAYKVGGQLFFDMYSESYGISFKDTIELLFSFTEPMSATLLEVNNLTRGVQNDGCGNWNPEDDYEQDCECTGGDEEITCSSATGGICCIPKSILDALCTKV